MTPRAYCDVAPYDRDLVAPEPRRPSIAALIGALVIGILLGSMGKPAVTLATVQAAPIPAGYETQRGLVERVKRESKQTPWQRALAAREAEGLPPWDERHSE